MIAIKIITTKMLTTAETVAEDAGEEGAVQSSKIKISPEDELVK